MKWNAPLFLGIFLCLLASGLHAQGKTTYFDKDDSFKKIKRKIEEANTGDRFIFPKKRFTFEETVYIKQSITIEGLKAKQERPDKLNDPKNNSKKKEKFPLLFITADGVTVKNFDLEGYYDGDREQDIIDKKFKNNPNDNPYETDKESLIAVHASNFVFENGTLNNSLQHGILVTPIDPPGLASPKDINGGRIEHIEGKGNHKDLVSLAGIGADAHVKNITVRDVTCRDSQDKGAVEASDGTDFITLKTITAKRSDYAVDVQDHFKASDPVRQQQTNRHITIDTIEAIDCNYAIKTANNDLSSFNGGIGHSDLTISNVVAKRCSIPIQVSNTTNVSLENICIIDDNANDSSSKAPYDFNENAPRISIDNCSGLSYQNISIEDKRGIYKQVNRVESDKISITVDLMSIIEDKCDN